MKQNLQRQTKIGNINLIVLTKLLTYLPMQLSRFVVPSKRVVFPSAHIVQLSASVVLLYQPIGQSEHTSVLFSVVLYVPFSHTTNVISGSCYIEFKK